MISNARAALVCYDMYDVFDIDKQKYLLPEERRKIIWELRLKHVPLLNGQYADKLFLDAPELSKKVEDAIQEKKDWLHKQSMLQA